MAANSRSMLPHLPDTACSHSPASLPTSCCTMACNTSQITPKNKTAGRPARQELDLVTARRLSDH